MVTAALIALAAIAVVMGATMVVSRVVDKVAVVDVAWGLMFVAVALALAVWSGDGHSWLLAAIVTTWGGRLAWHVGRRSLGQGEDPRYQEMLGDGGFGETVVRVFLLQAAVAFVISLPLQAAAAYDVRWTWLVFVGAGLWLVGLIFESVGDAQLNAYRARPKDFRPLVMDRGLWRWTRHPNYFGDSCVWWGLWLAGAMSLGWVQGLATVVAPLVMTLFLIFGTGARLLERTMMERPGYPEYAERTSMFFPLPPRSRPGTRRAT